MAGDSLGADVLGSLKYAADHLSESLKLIAVLGHSVLIVVQASAKKIHAAYGADISRHVGYRHALVEASIATHAALAAYSIQQEFHAGLQVVFGAYLLETREVWTPHLNEKRVGLAAAPRDAAEFTELGNAILRSERISSLLKTKD